MARNSLLIRLNIFLFLAWTEFILFTLSLILSSYIIKLFIMPFSKTFSPNIYDGIRLSITFVVITILQWLYLPVVERILKPSILSSITLISSQAFAIFLINKLLSKTIFTKYQLSYLAIFICFILPFYDFLISSFKKAAIKKL